MGEIADALRKANAEHDARREAVSEHRNGSPDRGPRDEWGYAASLSREITSGGQRGRASSEERNQPEESNSESANHQSGSPGTVRLNFESDLPDVSFDGHQPNVETSRHLALRIRDALEQAGQRSVAIVSPLRNDGKTTVACSIALALASVSAGRSVALVDMDLRDPSVSSRLGFKPKVGVEEVLLGKRTLSEVTHSFQNPDIDIFPARVPHHAAHELLIGQSLEDFVHDLEARYSCIVFDTPPTILVPDSTLLLKHVGRCVPVAHSGFTRKRIFESMLDILPSEKILGTVLNGVPLSKQQRGYYYSGYGAEEEAPH